MGIGKRPWVGAPKQTKSVPTSLTRMAKLMYVSFLIGGILLTAIAAVVFVPSITSFDVDESGWVPEKELERISFPGGIIIVREIRYDQFEKGYISICIEAQISSEENFTAYVSSRKDALSELLETVAVNSAIESVMTFDTPLKPEELMSLCETSIEKLGEYAVVVTDETTGTRGAGVLWFPKPQDPGFVQNITLIKEGYRLEGIIAVECYIKTEMARILQSDSRILLIDPLEDPMVLQIKKKYDSMGFYVHVERPFSQDMWGQYAKLKHGVTWVSSAGIGDLAVQMTS